MSVKINMLISQQALCCSNELLRHIVIYVQGSFLQASETAFRLFESILKHTHLHIFKLLGDKKEMHTDRKFLVLKCVPEALIYQHRKGMQKDGMFLALQCCLLAVIYKGACIAASSYLNQI